MSRHPFTAALFLFASLLVATAPLSAADPATDVFDRVEHHWADHDGTKIHYVTLGEGPPIVFVHGFPDFWYTWREQMAALEGDFKTVAIDTRGYNQSDKPRGVENYDMDVLVGDIDAVRRDLGVERMTVVGHDWGGVQAWKYAMDHPEHTQRLVIMNLTHPNGFAAVYANPTDAQRASTQYARRFIDTPMDDARSASPYAGMARGSGADVLARYQEAFDRSYADGMLNYYRANYDNVSGGKLEISQLQMPVLQFHGLLDTAVDKDGLKDTWNWIDGDYTLVTLPDVGHWVQRDGAEVVNATMQAWLLARQ